MSDSDYLGIEPGKQWTADSFEEPEPLTEETIRKGMKLLDEIEQPGETLPFAIPSPRLARKRAEDFE